MSTDGTVRSTIATHLQAFFDRSIDGVVTDYADDAVFIFQGGPLVGVAAIRAFFTRFFEALPDGFYAAFEMIRQETVGELGYIVWAAAPWVLLGTDSFVVRDGKIRLQTFAAHPSPAWLTSTV